jgi:hypothetical protein
MFEILISICFPNHVLGTMPDLSLFTYLDSPQNEREGSWRQGGMKATCHLVPAHLLPPTAVREPLSIGQ